MYRALLLLLVAGCALDQDLTAKDREPAFDDGDPPDTDPGVDTAAPVEACDGDDDDGDGLVDEDFPDSDGDGRADCVELECPALVLGDAGSVPIVEACAGEVYTGVSDPWNVVIERQYTTSVGRGVEVMPAVGNLTDDNGDGRVDADDVPEIAFTTLQGDTLVALDGATAAELFSVSGYGETGLNGVAIADVDADGQADVVSIRDDSRIVALDASGNEKWVSDPVRVGLFPIPTVADLEGDGFPEVIADRSVVDGRDGRTVTILDLVGDHSGTPVPADLDQDGTQEIIYGGVVYDHEGNPLWQIPAEGYVYAAVLDVDGDPEGEVAFVSNVGGHLYDSDGSLLLWFTIPGGELPGPPCAADFDGDGEVELAVGNHTQLTVFEVDGTQRWSAAMVDASIGLAGCSGFDVDADGAYEVLFADGVSFRIFDGATGAIRYESTSHSSGTFLEYPVVADVDADGSAEIVVADSIGDWQGITVYGHAADGWPRSGPTWGIHDYAVTNLESDGAVPASPVPSWQAYNVFRARPSLDGPARADLRVEITDVCVADCDYGPVTLGIQATNQGGAAVEAGALVAIYALDETPRFVTSVALPEMPAGTMLAGIEVELTPADVGENGFLVRVDDDGSGRGTVSECDEANNEDAYGDVICF